MDSQGEVISITKASDDDNLLDSGGYHHHHHHHHRRQYYFPVTTVKIIILFVAVGLIYLVLNQSSYPPTQFFQRSSSFSLSSRPNESVTTSTLSSSTMQENVRSQNLPYKVS
ncbi:transmembrane protein 192 [Striga asiatica]|uniref:Transmembrane protein 192 n=1 Tax=Striga asiatica TaxID=4170 RepID=A0A5A7QLN7_STRAF|nr:transmembrane protein 192 [Striga asiatica]